MTENRIREILNMENVCIISDENRLIDLEDYEEIYSDGRFSNRGFDILYNDKNGSLVKYEWSQWQGEGCYYNSFSWEDYLNLCPLEEDHFDRWVSGLKMVFRPDND